MIRNKIKKMLEGLPDEELQEIFWTVEAVRKNYLFKKNLQDKGVVVSEIYEGFEQIVAAWDCAFAHNMSVLQ
ncbi:hypothetical protein ACTHSJ_33860 [Paenibacillus cellulositrophicus]|uniref:hypothetical protein n=1 Tax=Paenibacillus cellulositrophicus TaxID=562959 RepID=UPI003F81A591